MYLYQKQNCFLVNKNERLILSFETSHSTVLSRIAKKSPLFSSLACNENFIKLYVRDFVSKIDFECLYFKLALEMLVTILNSCFIK